MSPVVQQSLQGDLPVAGLLSHRRAWTHTPRRRCGRDAALAAVAALERRAKTIGDRQRRGARGRNAAIAVAMNLTNRSLPVRKPRKSFRHQSGAARLWQMSPNPISAPWACEPSRQQVGVTSAARTRAAANALPSELRRHAGGLGRACTGQGKSLAVAKVIAVLCIASFLKLSLATYSRILAPLRSRRDPIFEWRPFQS